MFAEWMFTKMPVCEDDIKIIEEKLSFAFPSDYKNRIVAINAGAPQFNRFAAKNGGEKTINNLYSLNFMDGISYILNYQIRDSDYENLLVAIARDGLGNKICYVRSDKSIVFWNHEKDTIDLICGSFSEFEELLHSYLTPAAYNAKKMEEA